MNARGRVGDNLGNLVRRHSCPGGFGGARGAGVLVRCSVHSAGNRVGPKGGVPGRWSVAENFTRALDKNVYIRIIMVSASSAVHWSEENAMFAASENPLLPSRPNAVDVPPDGGGCKPWPSVAKADQPLTAKHTLATGAEDVVFPEDFHRGTTARERHGIHNQGGKRPKIAAKHRVLGHFGHFCQLAEKRPCMRLPSKDNGPLLAGRAAVLRKPLPQAHCSPAEKNAQWAANENPHTSIAKTVVRRISPRNKSIMPPQCASLKLRASRHSCGSGTARRIQSTRSAGKMPAKKIARGGRFERTLPMIMAAMPVRHCKGEMSRRRCGSCLEPFFISM